MGFKDGTRNIKSDDAAALDQHVWVRRHGRPGLDPRRQLPRGAPDPDVHRAVGPRPARRPERRLRAGQGHGGAAHREERARRAGLRRDRRRGQPRDRRERAHPARRVREQQRAADPAPRLLLHRRHRRGHRYPRRRAVLHQLPVRPAPRSSRSNARWAPTTPSTSTSGTPDPGCSPAHPGSPRRATTGAAPSWRRERGQRVTHASGAATRTQTASGRVPAARSARVTASRTSRRLTRTAIHTSRSDPAAALAEPVRRLQGRLVGEGRPGRCETRERRDEQGVGRALRLAHEAARRTWRLRRGSEPLLVTRKTGRSRAQAVLCRPSQSATGRRTRPRRLVWKSPVAEAE